MLNKGNVFDVSKERANGNFKSNSMPYLMTSNYNVFSKLVDIIMSEHLKPEHGNINVYGHVGIGKTRLVFEAASYLKHRYNFNKGVYMLDLNNIHDLSHDLGRIIKTINHSCPTLKTNNPSFDKIKSGASNKLNKLISKKGSKISRIFSKELSNDFIDEKLNRGGLLLIFDNCDKFV